MAFTSAQLLQQGIPEKSICLSQHSVGIHSYAKIPKRSGTLLHLVFKIHTLQHLWLAPLTRKKSTHFVQIDREFSGFLFRINKKLLPKSNSCLKSNPYFNVYAHFPLLGSSLCSYTKDCILPGINTYKNHFLAMKDPFPYNTFVLLKKKKKKTIRKTPKQKINSVL